MKIAVAGAGAMGSILGGLLSLGGAEVFFVDPFEAHMKAIAQRGLRLQLGTELHTIQGIRTFSHPEQLSGPVDVELLMVKAAMNEDVLEQTACLRTPETLLLTFQNGLGHPELLSRFAAEDRVAYGCLNITGRLTAPGCVDCSAVDPTAAIVFGLCQTTGRGLELARRLEALFCSLPPLHAHYDSAVAKRIWDKVLINCALNPLGAILNMTGPALARNPYTRDLMCRAADEAEAVAAAVGIDGVHADVFRKSFIPALLRGPENYPSMAIDIQNHRKTEIDYINGAVSAKGRRLGVPTPVNDLLTAMIHALEELTAR